MPDDVKQESDGRFSVTDENGQKRIFSTREEAQKALDDNRKQQRGGTKQR